MRRRPEEPLEIAPHLRSVQSDGRSQVPLARLQEAHVGAGNYHDAD